MNTQIKCAARIGVNTAFSFIGTKAFTNISPTFGTALGATNYVFQKGLSHLIDNSKNETIKKNKST